MELHVSYELSAKQVNGLANASLEVSCRNFLERCLGRYFCARKVGIDSNYSCSLPAAVLRDDGILPKHQDYDDAHSQEQECTEIYRNCNHSIWDPNFVF